MTVKLQTEHHLESLSLKEAYTGSSKSTLVKMPNCWKSHFAAHFLSLQNFNMKATGLLFLCCFVRLVQYVFMVVGNHMLRLIFFVFSEFQHEGYRVVVFVLFCQTGTVCFHGCWKSRVTDHYFFFSEFQHEGYRVVVFVLFCQAGTVCLYGRGMYDDLERDWLRLCCR